jgi:LuxR family glucitol operon transcriptional activator
LYAQRGFEAILQLTAKETVLTEKGIRAFSRSLYSLENLLDHILALFEQPLEGDVNHRKMIAVDLLCTWKTLLVLDNMETVSDGRVLTFIQELPPANQSKIVLTSRQKTGAWELPIPVSELNANEVREFIFYKSAEISATFPLDIETSARVERVSGGLPLAIQWIIGQYKRTRRLDAVLSGMKEKDSPVLEFSFRNIWSVLGGEAKTLLAIMSVFDGPVTTQQLNIATEMHPDAIDKALSDLVDVTLVTRSTQQSDGRMLYSALPITLSFAQHQLASMGDLEIGARRRLNQFSQQMELQSSEIARFQSIFQQYGLSSDNERRAAILCRRAESEVFAGNLDVAEALFKQARDLSPNSAYVHAMCASYELTQKRLGAATQRIDEACRRATAKTGALCYTIRARILDAQRHREATIEAFEKAVGYDPADMIIRHQYGVALSRAGRTKQAIEQFTNIIDVELKRTPPRETLLMALTTRVINLRRLGQHVEARADLALARDVVRRNPHLEHASYKLSELEDEST